MTGQGFPTTGPGKRFIRFGVEAPGVWEVAACTSTGSVRVLQFRRGTALLGEVYEFTGEGGVPPCTCPIAYGGKRKRIPRGGMLSMLDAILWVERRILRHEREAAPRN